MRKSEAQNLPKVTQLATWQNQDANPGTLAPGLTPCATKIRSCSWWIRSVWKKWWIVQEKENCRENSACPECSGNCFRCYCCCSYWHRRIQPGLPEPHGWTVCKGKAGEETGSSALLGVRAEDSPYSQKRRALSWSSLSPTTLGRESRERPGRGTAVCEGIAIRLEEHKLEGFKEAFACQGFSSCLSVPPSSLPPWGFCCIKRMEVALGMIQLVQWLNIHI